MYDTDELLTYSADVLWIRNTSCYHKYVGYSRNFRHAVMSLREFNMEVDPKKKFISSRRGS